jgi:hypothetical protein
MVVCFLYRRQSLTFHSLSQTAAAFLAIQFILLGNVENVDDDAPRIIVTKQFSNKTAAAAAATEAKVMSKKLCSRSNS